jgi:uncharacterized protein involved in exopolysaccharide biosynthesis
VTAFLSFAFVATRGFLQKRTYTSQGSFVTRSARAPQALSGIAAQFGISVSTGDPGQSPAFYADLLKSRAVLDTVAQTTYTIPTDSGIRTGRLEEVLRYPDPTPELRRERAIRYLRSAARVDVSLQTGIVQLEVRTPSAELSYQLARALLTAVDRFNRQSRRSQAQAERQFTERRLGEVGRDLRTAEDRLLRFLEANREIREGSILAVERDRLSREVTNIRQVQTSLIQAYEQAKIEEVRDTPVISVVDQPYRPVRPDGRRIIVRSGLALIFGFTAGVLLALVTEGVSRSADSPSEDAREFHRLLRAFVHRLRHPFGGRSRRPEPAELA